MLLPAPRGKREISKLELVPALIYIFANDTFSQKKRTVRVGALFSARVFILSNTSEGTP
jgi:hypothetical protein